MRSLWASRSICPGAGGAAGRHVGLRVWFEGRGWVLPEGHAPDGIERLAPGLDGTLLAGGGSGAWRLGAQGWKPLWRGQGKPGNVSALMEEKDGSLLIGTHDGLARLGPDGCESPREFQGLKITAFARCGGVLWTGTWNDGLRALVDGTWRAYGYAQGLPDHDVQSLACDKAGRLWVGLYGEGTLAADASDWLAAVRDARRPPPPVGNLYQSIEQARNALPPGSRSKDMERSHDGRELFRRGRRVWPAGPPVLRNARGDEARVKSDRSWTLRRDGREQELPASPHRGWTAPLLDSRGRLWLGTSKAGVLVQDGSAWKAFGAESGLADNPVDRIAEDPEGAIWVGTSPRYDREANRYLHANLHRYDGRAWRHWSPDDGLGYWGTQDVVPLSGGHLAVATNGGLSILKDSSVLRNYNVKDGLQTPKNVASLLWDAPVFLDVTLRPLSLRDLHGEASRRRRVAICAVARPDVVPPERVAWCPEDDGLAFLRARFGERLRDVTDLIRSLPGGTGLAAGYRAREKRSRSTPSASRTSST